MENQRKQYRALRGICLRAALVLVSAVPDLDSEWHNDSVLVARVDGVAGSHRRLLALFRDKGGMGGFLDIPGGGCPSGWGVVNGFLASRFFLYLVSCSGNLTTR